MPPERGEQRSGPVELCRSCAPRPLRHAWERARRGENSGPPRSHRAGPRGKGRTSLGRAEPRWTTARSAARLSFPSPLPAECAFPRPPARPSVLPPAPSPPPCPPDRVTNGSGGRGPRPFVCPRPGSGAPSEVPPLPFPILPRCPPPLCLFFFLSCIFPPFLPSFP